MENCAFIDIFTTHNDLYGHNNCPIQFCCELFTNNEIFEEDKFFKPERRKLFNIIPDEEILIPGYLNSGIKNDDVRTSDYNGLELKQALETIYKILKAFKEKGFFIIGYNHIVYDLEILNKNFQRVLNYDPIVFDKDKLIDVMKLAEMSIPVNEIGNYSMDSVMTFFHSDCNKVQNLRINKSTATDIKITKMILIHFIEKGMTFSDISKMMNSEREVKVINFGKYKGASLETIFDIDKQYCNWLIKNKDIGTQNPSLVAALKKMFNTVVE